MGSEARVQGSAAPPRPGWYRPHLDGLRAVAVYLVVLFHAGVSMFSGGFIGVDVFFVLSGYLVTQLLLRDLVDQGSIRLGRFYSRRIRRLLPASVLALLVTAAVYAAVASPVAVAEAADAIRAALLYYANWFFIAESTDYFADVSRSPVLHFWSLAVEEQFYVVWPLVLGGLWAACRRFERGVTRGLPVVVAVGALVSAAWALSLRADQPSLAYLGTGARAYQLLVGALLALAPALLSLGRVAWGWFLAPIGLVAVVVLGTSLVEVDPVVRGVFVAGAVLALLVGLDGRPAGPMARLLSLDVVVYLGRISYGTYLWHWPVIILVGELELSPSPWALAGVTFLAATALAALSFHLIETPTRTSASLSRHRWSIVGAGLGVSALAALVLLPAVTDAGSSSARNSASEIARSSWARNSTSSDAAGGTPVPASYDAVETYYDMFGDTVECVDSRPEDCTVVNGSGTHILLMGDSNALMLVPGFTALAEAEGLRLSLEVTAGCPWEAGVYRHDAEIRAQCLKNKVDAYERVIAVLDPDVVVAVSFWDSNLGATLEDSEFSQALHAATIESVATLSEHRDVVIVRSIARPDDGIDRINCLAEATYVEDCRFVVTPRNTWLDDLHAELAAGSDRVSVLDLRPIVCPSFPECEPMVGGIPVFWNGDHITRRYSATLAEPLGEQLRALGVL